MEEKDVRWHTRSGISIPISELTNSHLKNIVNLLDNLNISEELKDIIRTEYVHRLNNGIIIKDAPTTDHKFMF